MGKTPKKKKKKKKRDLAHRLRRLGLRKELAKRIADNAVNARGQIPGTARETIKEIRAKVDDLGAEVFKTTKRGAPDGEAPKVDAEAAAKQQRQEQQQASTQKLARKTKKVKKKLKKKAKRARKAAKAKPKKAG